MNTRLLRFLEAENISQSQFADSIGVARASISHILSGRNKPGFDFLEKLASQYPNLSLEWLVTGRGRMYNAGGEDAESLENALPLAPKGQIDRIVVFFSDGTFKEFK
ncbi:MAG: helix-turn-helix transcriptional regulator [Bacteroidales bacterium]|nr:helix-turn-helix transcriptional regulator [Bacteroidales bacterium]